MKTVILKIPLRRPRRIAGFSAGGFLKTSFAGSTFHLPGSQGVWARYRHFHRRRRTKRTNSQRFESLNQGFRSRKPLKVREGGNYE